MSEANTVTAEADRLFELLNAYDVPPVVLESGLKRFSSESKNELASRIARRTVPTPSGRLLARLLFILTDSNRNDVTAAYVNNLQSPLSDARKFSLYGLQQLQHPALTEFAKKALTDPEDQVLTASYHILLPEAKRDPQLWKLLQEKFDVHKADKSFSGSTNLLRAHGIEGPAPGH
jgi:hypothetical protein